MNPILEEVEKIGGVLAEYREKNDERLEAIKTGSDTIAAELGVKLGKMDEVIDGAQAVIKNIQTDYEKQAARVEMLEALADRPKGTEEEQKEARHAELFMKSLRDGFSNSAVTAELQQLQTELKDVTIGSNIGGGYALPKQIGADVDALLLKLSEVVANVKNVRVGTSDYQELVSIHGGTSGWVAETGSRSATGTPNLRSRKPTWGELYAYPQVSEWSIQDLMFNVATWLTGDVAEGMSVALATAIWSGDGSAKPTGMTDGTPVATDDHASPLRGAGAFEYIPAAVSPLGVNGDNIIDLVYGLNPRYRSGAKFSMNTVTQGAVRKLKDSNGQYLWQPSLQAGQPDRILGYELFTWEDMANPTTADGFPIAFGDFSRSYLLASRSELMIQSEGVTNPGYIRFYVRRRYGGIVLNNDSLKLMKLSAT